MDVCACTHTYMSIYVHTHYAYICTYIYVGSYMIDTQTDTHVCLQTCMHTYITHTFQPIKLHIILELSISTIFRFTYLPISRISIFLEIWKSDNSGNTCDLAIVQSTM